MGITNLKKKRFRTHSNPFNYDFVLNKLNLAKCFANPSFPLDLEFGFGMGKFLAHISKKEPKRNVVGFEIRKQVVEYVKNQVAGLPNIYVVHGAAKNGLRDCIANKRVDRVYIFHPDPWFKAKHHKRRLINSVFIDLLLIKMKPGACVYISTDVQELMEDIKKQFSAYTANFMPIKSSFWEEVYYTHWAAFSKQDKRQSFQMCYQFVTG